MIYVSIAILSAIAGGMAYAAYQRAKHGRKFDDAVDGVMSLVAQMDANLAKRKATRLVESERVKAGKIAARRKAWERDPLRQAQ